MKKNKLVIFDWGGVVESHTIGEYNFNLVYKNIIKRLGVESVPEDYLIKLHNISRKYHISEINTEKEFNFFIEELYNVFNLDFCKEDYFNFRKIYKEEFNKIDYYKEVAEFARNLTDSCQVGILSNLCMLDKERIDKHFNLSYFDYVWLSFEMGLRKPNLDIYIKVLDESGFNARDILFIDDSIENLKEPHSLGFHTLLATGKDLYNIKQNVFNFIK